MNLHLYEKIVEQITAQTKEGKLSWKTNNLRKTFQCDNYQPRTHSPKFRVFFDTLTITISEPYGVNAAEWRTIIFINWTLTSEKSFEVLTELLTQQATLTEGAKNFLAYFQE